MIVFVALLISMILVVMVVMVVLFIACARLRLATQEEAG
jgi:hypothetical protein